MAGPYQNWAGIYTDSSSKADWNLIAQKLDKSVDLLADKIDQFLALHQQSPTQYIPPNQEIYSNCARPTHYVSECPTATQFLPFIQEQVPIVPRYFNSVNEPFANTYNPNWSNHPNFSWRPQQTQAETQIPPMSNFQYLNRGQPSQCIQPFYDNQLSYSPPQQTNLADDRFDQLQQLIMTQQQSIVRLEAQIEQITESAMRRKSGQFTSQPIENLINNPPILNQSPESSLQSNVPFENPQFEDTQPDFELSGRILRDPYQDQVSEASIDASQNENLEEEVSTETNPIEEPELEAGTDAGFNLSENDIEKKKVDDLSEIYKPKIQSSSALKGGSFTYLESSDTLSISIALNSTPNSKTQFMSVLEEQIGKLLNRFINYFLNIKRLKLTKKGVINYFLKIGLKIFNFINKEIVGQVSEIGNPKPLEFVNPIFDTG